MIAASVQDRLRRFDSRLRLREIQAPDPSDHLRDRDRVVTMIAVERQDRAGTYQRIGLVRPDLLGDGTGLIAKLKTSDTREYGGGAKAADAFDDADRQAEATRKAFRQDEFQAMAKDGYDTIARRTGRRVNNAGIPERTS
jgi:hypothetical protein